MSTLRNVAIYVVSLAVVAGLSFTVASNADSPTAGGELPRECELFIQAADQMVIASGQLVDDATGRQRIDGLARLQFEQKLDVIAERYRADKAACLEAAG